jgi:hypothetical protein
MIYINNTAKLIYVELDSALDAESNLIGTTWEDYLNGYWILLSDEQISFRNENPEASVYEVFNMELGPIINPDIPEIEIAKNNKLLEISNADRQSNKFFISVTTGGVEVSNVELWIDKDLRNSLYSITLPALKKEGHTKTKLWTNELPPVSIEVPIDWALDKLPLLEVYAKETYDKKAENEAAVYDAYDKNDLEALNNLDVYANYPLVRTFELNLDL